MEAFDIVVAVVFVAVIAVVSFSLTLTLVLPVVALAHRVQRSHSASRSGPVVTSLKWSGGIAGLLTARLAFRALVFPFIDGHDVPSGVVTIGELAGCPFQVGVRFVQADELAELCSEDIATADGARVLVVSTEKGCWSGRFAVSIDVRSSTLWSIRTRQHPSRPVEMVSFACGQGLIPYSYAFALKGDTEAPDAVRLYGGWGTEVLCYRRNLEWEVARGPC